MEVEGRRHREDDHGGTVLATTVRPEAGTDTAILQAYQDPTTPVEPGLRWLKNPAALAPVWLETPAGIAALAMLTGSGVLVSSLMQRQVRLSLHTPGQQVPGHTGTTARPTAAVGLALLSQGALVEVWRDDQGLTPMYGVQAHHRLRCHALGLDSSWYEVPSAYTSGQCRQTP